MYGFPGSATGMFLHSTPKRFPYSTALARSAAERCWTVIVSS
ncbi:hypothetical protein ACU686_37145 [Yinghuangia aomiensis]